MKILKEPKISEESKTKSKKSRHKDSGVANKS